MKKIGMALAAVGMALAVVTVAMTGQPEGPTGACCFDGNCVIESESTCFFVLAGIYQGDGTTCGPDGCGACCFTDDSCLDNVSSAVCPEMQGGTGTYQGQASQCIAVDCSPCLGDVNDDGEIGIEEFLFVIGNWGPCQ